MPHGHCQQVRIAHLVVAVKAGKVEQRFVAERHVIRPECMIKFTTGELELRAHSSQPDWSMSAVAG